MVMIQHVYSTVSNAVLDILDTMADIGATIADNFEVMNPGIGKSFLEKLK